MLVAHADRLEPARKEQDNVRNRLIATCAGLLGGLETLAFVIIICSR